MSDCVETARAQGRRRRDGRQGPGPLLVLAAIALIAMARHRKRAMQGRFGEGSADAFGGRLRGRRFGHRRQGAPTQEPTEA